MSDSIEVVIVTAAAVAALGVLLWPLVPRRRGGSVTAKSPGCSACENIHGADPARVSKR